MEIAARTWSRQQPRQGSRLGGLVLTVLLHAAAILVLLQYAPVRSAFTQAMPIMASLITPPPVVEKPHQPPQALPVKPLTRPPPAPEPQQLIAATTEVPAPAPAAAPPAPVPATAPVVTASVAQPQLPQPVAPVTVPVVPPSYMASYLDNPPPVYPALSRRIGEQGQVMLRVLVNARGTADNVELRAGSGSSRLDDAALEAVKRWRFVPARQGDRPVAAWVLIPITFSLKG